MTDHHETAHLDDELLSAVLDGEADVDASAHADACDRCRLRLGTLRDVSVLIAAPVPPADPARRDAAIEAAMAAMDRTVVPMRRRRTPPAWLAAAAAVVVAVGAISLLSRGGNDDDGGFDTAVGGSDEGAGDVAADDGSDLDMFALAAPLDGGDLGEVDAATLRQRIDDAFGVQRNSAVAESTESDAAAGTMQAAAPVPCEGEVRAGSPELGALVYRANGTIDSVAVIVLAFDVTPDRWVYVVTVDGCTIRNQQTYSP